MFVVVVGTRPEIIKISPVVKALKGRPFKLVLSGQHFSHNMSRLFVEELGLGRPDFVVGLKAMEPAQRLEEMVRKISKIISSFENPTVMVLGDTETTLAGAIAAKLQGKRLVHIEAGYRCFDNSVREEAIRKAVDRISDVLFVPTKSAMQNLLNEGIERKRLFLVGNTIQDASLHGIRKAKKSTVFKKFSIPKDFALLTMHRQETVDDKKKLGELLGAIGCLKSVFVYPIHPRTKKNIRRFGLRLPKNIVVLPPLGYLDFLALFSKAKAVFTDSGGIEEEAVSINVPCLVLRKKTEYLEALKAGKLFLAFTKREIIKKGSKILEDKGFVAKTKGAKNPYARRNVARRIVSILGRLQ